ncbi:hypothetical protein E4413_02560 [Leptospira interrogans]|nr:hypothetical protein C5473_09680 [Leptospira interrogans serovar Weerasinghe]QCO39940.1 hypothetical protein E4413_02560 [Leptospira interrogans]
MKLKTKYNITFLSCNLSTGAESAVRQRRIRPVFYSEFARSMYKSIELYFYYILPSNIKVLR